MNTRFTTKGITYFHKENYNFVVGIEAKDLDEVFSITNSNNYGYRSTSVGDVVVSEKGEAFLCDIIGWKRLPAAN